MSRWNVYCIVDAQANRSTIDRDSRDFDSLENRNFQRSLHTYSSHVRIIRSKYSFRYLRLYFIQRLTSVDFRIQYNFLFQKYIYAIRAHDARGRKRR